MVMLFYAKQNAASLSKFGDSDIEDNLKSSCGLFLMMNGKLEGGKTLILEYFHS